MKVYSLSSRSPEQPCHFHGCLRHALRVARWLGFFPVQGLGEIRPEGIRFKIKSFYSIYAVATLLGQVMMSYFALLLFFQTEVTLSSISNIVFYVTSLITNILLLKLAQQWPYLMTKAVETERGLTELTLDHKVAGRSSVLAYLVMALAMVEHILCTSFNIKFVMYCLQEAGVTTNVMENYVVHRMPYIFNYIPYSFFSAIFFEYLCLQSTFLWSFNDVIITCFSIYITAYFKTLNVVIATNVKKDKDGIPWSILRVHYSNLVKLVKEIDDHISSLILLSFFTDLFYICLQLFNSLHRNHVSFKYCDETQTNQALSSPFYLLYYLYSFVFLVLRALMLSLFASNVHCAALEPVYSVYDVPSSVYDNEVRRFQLQLHYTEVGLSGKFFYVTRNMILKV
nr:gustatory receptor GR12 [Spodoptera frugiperda]